jgi:hypothetical protein
MKSKYILSLLVLIVLGAAVWYFGMKPESPSTNNGSNSPTPTPTSNNSNNSGSSIVEEIPNGLEGELRASTDKKRGNLMLMVKDSDRVVYLNTSRDFSSLIGKQVVVTIEGSLDDFRLLDIKAK